MNLLVLRVCQFIPPYSSVSKPHIVWTHTHNSEVVGQHTNIAGSVLCFYFFCNVSLTEIESHIPLLSIRKRQNCLMCFFQRSYKSTSHLKKLYSYQCLVVVTPFISNRIAPVVLHVLDFMTHTHPHKTY